MLDTQTINLSELVSEQPNGIVLIFSRYYSNAAQDDNFNSFFVPKVLVATKGGLGSSFLMATSNFGVVCQKYLYISNGKIVGNANNSLTGTGTSGIVYANNGYVLRYVIGV